MMSTVYCSGLSQCGSNIQRSKLGRQLYRSWNGATHVITWPPLQARTVECNGLDRRDLLATISGSIILADSGTSLAGEVTTVDEAPTIGAATLDQTAFEKLTEPVLAYEFEYPVTTRSGHKLPLVFSRKPERYSSAAPLTADARQRIVCELADLVDAVTITVSVGPPAGTLKTTKPSDWTAKQVAEQVLADRSTARVTSGQRVSLNTVENAFELKRGDTIYYVYEHISQGSPTMVTSSRETYRHALAVTAARPGQEEGNIFLYSLNMSCPQEKWDDLESGFKRGIDSFRLSEGTASSSAYVPPDAEPWRFF